MASSTIAPNRQLKKDSEIWESLKQAIAVSSGFECWKEEKMTKAMAKASLDEKVRCYLRDTLATLAY